MATLGIACGIVLILTIVATVALAKYEYRQDYKEFDNWKRKVWKQ
jgi:uncharacterized membrane protein